MRNKPELRIFKFQADFFPSLSMKTF